MKLRSLTLENVRRFGGQRAHLEGIGDGLTVVAEANEFGKSTFFDALHALFFLRHGSMAAPAKSLQPHAGGPVRITAEVDLPNGRFAIAKTFLQRKTAQVTRLSDGQVIARGGEADDWVEETLSAMAGGAGPTGLLWVRQGLTGFEPRDKDQVGARRDLLSSVAGEIEEMTGGRSMDRILRRAEAALAEIATPGQGRPKGPRKAVEDALSAARVELESVTRDCADLSQALTDRARKREELARLSDADLTARQAEALRAAEAQEAAAQAHARQLETAATALEVARLEEDAARQSETRHAALLDTLREATEAMSTAQDNAAKTADALRTATQEAGAARAKAEALEVTAGALRKARDAAQAAALSTRAAEEAARLTKLLEQVDGHIAQARKAEAAAHAIRATPARLRSAEQTEQDLARLRAQLAAGAVTLRMEHSGTARAVMGGAPMPDDAPVPLAENTALDLPGLGRLHITVPGTEARDLASDVARADAALQQALQACGAKTLAAARDAAARREAHLGDAAMAQRLLQTLAPDGRDALDAKRAEAVQRMDAGLLPPTRPLEEIIPELEQAEEQLRAARHRAETLAEAQATARADASAAEAARMGARSRCDAAMQAAGPADSRAERAQSLARALQQATGKRQEADRALNALRETAPDPDTARANLARARAAVDNTKARKVDLERELAGLEERIGARAERGVEERKAELTEEVAALDARAAAYREEVAALSLLIDTLSATRAAARDVYFGPVQQEIRPLLQLLHGEADLQWQDEALLPDQLDRSGQSEAFETLSGGTQEQIAILTRLAFARLYARRGTHIPVILDDALVYSDDDRIVQMFTALNRVAMDQQVIVFSCRQMAFAALGGTRPRVQVTPLDGTA